MRVKRKDGKIPFWIQVTAIILVGVIASLSVVLYFQDKNAERFTVTFAYADGTSIEKKQVKAGKGVFPPIIETNGVFRGWDMAINEVTQNVETHPMIYTIVEDNLFYFDSVYVKEGKRFTVDLFVAGNVNISNGELLLEYDPEVIEYKKYDGLDLSNIEKTEDGQLSIEFNSKSVLSEKTELAKITFYAKKKDVYATQIDLISKETKVVSNKSEVVVDNATINNNIY